MEPALEEPRHGQETDPHARFTVVTLGVADVGASSRFYEALGFVRKMRATGDAVAFLHTGGTVLALYPWDKLAEDAQVPDQPRPQAFRGVTLAWNCTSRSEVDARWRMRLRSAAGR